MVYIVKELARQGVLSKMPYADELVLMSKGFSNKVLKWMEALKSMGLKVNLGKTKVIVSDAIKRMACLKVKLTHVGSAV